MYSACELQGVTKIGRRELEMDSSHNVVFFLPRMNFLLGKYIEAFMCPAINIFRVLSLILLNTCVSKTFVFAGKLCDLLVCGLWFIFCIPFYFIFFLVFLVN